jgi:iron complex outermembrane receptor protein
VPTFDAFNAVSVRDSLELAKNMTPTLGEALDDLPGVATRSFGPGSARPIIRGFDGDRVLIMQDGVRTGDLSSQSGDHGVSLDPASLERIEVVRGPATLLYGSNAIGGVVNAITPQEAYRNRPLRGLVGQVTSDFGSANGQAGGNVGVQYGAGFWFVWGGGGARRTGDYEAPDGDVPNSASRMANARAGFGYFGVRPYFSIGYQGEDGRYGVPYAGEFHEHGEEEGHGEDEGHAEEEHAEEVLVDLETRRHSLRVETGVRALEVPAFESFRIVFNYLDWRHDEIEIEDGAEALGTRFDNETFVFRAEADQKRTGRLSGRLWAPHLAAAARAQKENDTAANRLRPGASTPDPCTR